MSERENNVYKAKLAEQAERYDGEYLFVRIWGALAGRLAASAATARRLCSAAARPEIIFISVAACMCACVCVSVCMHVCMCVAV